MSREPTFLGTVQDVKGATIRVALDPATVSGVTFVEGETYRIGQVGSFVRVALGYVDLFGVVSQVGAGAVPEGLAEKQPYGNRWMTIQLVGEARGSGGFERGVAQYPTIEDEVHLVTASDLRRIYGKADDPNFVRVGHLASAETIPAFVDIGRLVARHSAVVGATGAGKSTTVAGLLLSISGSRYPSTRIVVFDLHGEYARALGDRATVFKVNPDPERGEEPLHIPYWALTFDELLPATLGTVDDASRAAVLEKITALKRSALETTPRAGVSVDTLTVDSPVPFSIRRLWYDLHFDIHATYVEDQTRPQSEWQLAFRDGEGAQGDAETVRPPLFRPHKNIAGDPEKIRQSTSTLSIRRQLGGLASRLRDPRYAFLFEPGQWAPNPEGLLQQDLDTLLHSWLGGARPITILDLSGIPTLVLNDLIGALLRILYDALFWARNLPEGGRERPLLLVLEEAHAYVRHERKGPATDAVERIAKEGRKYGLGLMLVSQRPSEIEPTILSQCGTLFAMRMANATDRGQVMAAAAENLEGVFDMLPILRTGEVVVVGEAVSLPIRAVVEPPTKDKRPDSDDPRVVATEVPGDGFEGPGGWNQRRDPSDYAEVLRMWRAQNPRSPRIVATAEAAAAGTPGGNQS
jgi:DNA helicase HerA-like ATPase